MFTISIDPILIHLGPFALSWYGLAVAAGILAGCWLTTREVHQVAPDGRSVWAVSGHNNQALAVNTSTYQLLSTAPTGHHPAHIVLSQTGGTPT